MRIILTTLKVLIVVLIGGVMAYHWSALGNKNLPLWEDIKTSFLTKYFPCKEPIHYTLGTFDERFKISKEDFLKSISDAEDVWEIPSGKYLFTYDPDNTSSDVLKVNLVYDYREQATEKLSSLGITVKNTKASYDMLKDKLFELKRTYDEGQADLSLEIEAFNEEQAEYGKKVKYWNSHGGAPSDEYEKMREERRDLERKSADLKQTSENLNEMADEIEALVTSINGVAKSINLSVRDYNNISNTRGETFEEGVYRSDGSERNIDIYEFANREKLVRVLAHEFGHALGLEHVMTDPKAIMYSSNEGSKAVLTAADMYALQKLCGTE